MEEEEEEGEAAKDCVCGREGGWRERDDKTEKRKVMGVVEFRKTTMGKHGR